MHIAIDLPTHRCVYVTICLVLPVSLGTLTTVIFSFYYFNCIVFFSSFLNVSSLILPFCCFSFLITQCVYERVGTAAGLLLITLSNNPATPSCQLSQGLCSSANGDQLQLCQRKRCVKTPIIFLWENTGRTTETLRKHSLNGFKKQ